MQKQLYRHFIFSFLFLFFSANRILRPLKRSSPPNSITNRGARPYSQLLPINQLYLAMTGTFFQNLVILVRVYRFRESSLCPSSLLFVELRLAYECANAHHDLATPLEEKSHCVVRWRKRYFLFFSPLFIESKRGDDLSSKKTDFSRKICTLGRKVLREDIFEEGEKGRMIMGSEENERILIGLGIWSWNGESISF